jgi:adenosylcobinamide-phosphate guanylyltransferase
MNISALVMAGGKGSRLGVAVEKPLLSFLGIPLIDRVANALVNAKKVTEFTIVTSPNTPETEKRCLQNGHKVFRAYGNGYHSDLKQVILEKKFDCPVLTVSADLPTLTGTFLDSVIDDFERCGLSAYVVYVPVAARERLGLSVSSIDVFEGKTVAISGVNIIDGSKINDPKIPSGALVTDDVAVLYNVNTLKDLELSECAIRKLHNQ